MEKDVMLVGDIFFEGKFSVLNAVAQLKIALSNILLSFAEKKLSPHVIILNSIIL
ncbi:hypothetical protein H8E88_14950 [candidate division KSB1 bacterium]|nr:hypothetical protein [candidate division KSB1 bacterium]